MKTLFTLAILAAAFAITSVLAEPAAGHCMGPQMDGMNARMNAIHDRMDRIEATDDRTEQRELMDLHMKQMEEGMRELRKRDMPAECRVEMMGSMMESMMRHQRVQQEGTK